MPTVTMTAMFTRVLHRNLGESDVAHLYRTLLGREPGRSETAAQLATARDWRTLLSAIVGSDEFRNGRPTPAVPSTDVRVNTWHRDLAEWGHPSGTWSGDREAVMGAQGFTFLVRGTNSVVDQYQDSYRLPGDWADRWDEVVQARRSGAAALGATFCALVVPDKLSVLREHLPPEIVLQTEPPALRLTASYAVDYPIAELTAVPGGAYLRTDTHLSFEGNAILGRWVLQRLAVGEDAALAATSHGGAVHSYLSSGDLGSRFEPPIVEVMRTVNSWGSAAVVEDNREAVEAVGKHVGTRRVLRNVNAADPRTVVMFGDSYGFPQKHYHGIAWYLAQHFREVHFVWVPFGWDGDYVAQVGATVVVCETAERFVPRPPATRIEVPALMAAAVVED